MILHIVKKDIRILWPYALGAALTDLAAAILQTMIEAIQLRADAQFLTLFLWAVNLIALVFGFAVIAMVVQLDPIPGTRQDWLARPIRRRDMLLAKLLFVTAFIQAPLLAADTLHGLLSGFPLGPTLVAAVPHNLYLFVLMTMPVMALAATTGGIKQTLGIGLAVSIGAIVFAGSILEIYVLAKVTSDNGHTSTSFVLQMAVLLAGAAAILVLQYFKRATPHARTVLGLAAVLAVAANLLVPKGAAYAIENRFSSSPGSGLSLAFAPQVGRLRAVESGNSVAGSENLSGRGVLVALPLVVERMSQQGILVGNNVRAILTAPDGDLVTLEAPPDVRLPTSGTPVRVFYQVLRVPSDFFDAHRDQPVRVELDYELVINGPQRAYDLAAQGDKRNIPQLGRCTTFIGPLGGNVLLRCMQVGEERMRVDAALTDDTNGLSNPPRHVYSPSDAPYRNGGGIITGFNANLFFRDMRSDTPFPVGPAQIPIAKVRLTVSEPLTWIHRRITVADVRLEAWTARDERASP